jgi:PadR family transcriptional regulator, regulatory protein PadR
MSSRTRSPGQQRREHILDKIDPLCRLSSMIKKTLSEPRLSYQSVKVLNTFLSTPSRELAGADLISGLEIASGTLYPILARFEEAGWLMSRWERGDPKIKGRPLRKLYRITANGLTRAAVERKEFLRGLAT